MVHYRKPALSLQDQLGKLKMREMIFADKGVAIQWLSAISFGGCHYILHRSDGSSIP
jgi:abortive infection bacteriophage resistance protein